MEVNLIRFTPDPDHLCGLAAATCYQSNNPMRSLSHALASGHDSVAEHASFTFKVTGISRVCLAQLTRHRIASFSVQSQRYCNVCDNPVTVPETVSESPFKQEFSDLQKQASILYQHMVSDGIPKEDARFILPQGTSTALIMTMNGRELRHFLSLRCCNRAQWEIREMAVKMLETLKEEAPVLFYDAGPGCVRGRCPESRPCGRPWQVQIREVTHEPKHRVPDEHDPFEELDDEENVQAKPAGGIRPETREKAKRFLDMFDSGAMDNTRFWMEFGRWFSKEEEDELLGDLLGDEKK